MSFEADFDLGRVVFVNEDKFTLDVIGINGNRYKDIPFLNLYSKPKDKGQGIYMMPERDSYAVIIRLKHQIMGASERFAIGFYNPLDEEGSYSSDREKINAGDFVFKTVFGNKIIGRTDGSITIMSSDQAQITLFPESGNKKDSFGYDNLIRLLFENFELNTDAGHIHQHVNKKDMSTNINFEVRNKPLYSEGPSLIRGNIGSQPPMEEEKDFITFSVYDIVAEQERIRQEFTWRVNGYKERTYYNDQEQKVAEMITGEDFSESVKHFENGMLLFEKTVSPTGDETIIKYGDGPNEKTSEIHQGDDGAYSRTIYSSGVEQYHIEVDRFGVVTENIKNDSGADVLQKVATDKGEVSIDLGTGGQISINLDGTTGNVQIETQDDITVKTTGKVKVDANDIALGMGTSGFESLVKQSVITAINGHNHSHPQGPTTGILNPIQLTGNITQEVTAK